MPTDRVRRKLRQAWPEGQLDNERSRTVVDGRRTDDGDLCTLVAVHETGGTWALYPHGWGRFGVRLVKAEAVRVAEAILAVCGE